MDPLSLRAVLPGREMEVDPLAYDDGADAGSSSRAEDSSSDSGNLGSEGSDLESMTGRGIKCLCSELIELKKTSEKDFQKNVYSNYYTFLRVFKEIKDVESELMELKRHVSDHKRLVDELARNFDADSFFEKIRELKVENGLEVGDYLLSKRQNHFISILEKLGILSSEQRFEEALDVLEFEKKTLQKIDREGNLISAETFTHCQSALSEWRIRLADQLAAIAGHPRVTASELQKTLLLLCRLGEGCQANSLLIQFYHSRFVNCVHDVQCSKPLLGQVYMVELAKATFSVISQAARSFIILYGETSPYSSEFMQWVVEEITTFIHYFDTYIRSMYERNQNLHLAVEGLECAFSFCSLLKPQRLVLRPYLTKLFRPCMKGLVQMHVGYLRKTIHFFTTTDTWILDKVPALGIVRETSSPVGERGKVEYCLLTSSGRKLVSLIQAILEDVHPLCSLQMESSILRGLADLFDEYMKILKCSIPSSGDSVEKCPPRISFVQELSQQFSCLVNTWTLLDYLLSIAKCIFEGAKANDEQISENYEASRHNELDIWIFSIQDAVHRLGAFFCQKFVDGYISQTALGTKAGSESDIKNLGLPALSQTQPSSEFQMLFLQLQKLDKCGMPVFGGADKQVEKLLKNLIDTAVTTISNNIMFSRDSEHYFPIQQSICFTQFILDICFLVEIARFGGYLSDDLMEASRILVADITIRFPSDVLDTQSAITAGAWASAAAKAAIQKLVEIEAERDGKHGNASEEDFNYESAQASSEQEATESAESSDREIETFAETGTQKPHEYGKSEVNPWDDITIDVKAGVSDDRDSTSPSTASVYIEGVPGALRKEAWINGSEMVRQTKAELGWLNRQSLEEDAAGRQNGCAAFANESVIAGQSDTGDVEFAYKKYFKTCALQSTTTQELAAKNCVGIPSKEHRSIEAAVVDKSPCDLLCSDNEFEEFAGEGTAAAAHAGGFSAEDDNYDNHASSHDYCIELTRSSADHPEEEDRFSSDKDFGAPKTRSRNLQFVADEEYKATPAGYLQPASPSDVVGSTTAELSVSDGSEPSPTAELIASFLQMTPDATKMKQR